MELPAALPPVSRLPGLRANLGGIACGRTSIFTSNGKDWLKPKIGDARLTVGLSAVLAGCSAPSRKRNPRRRNNKLRLAAEKAVGNRSIAVVIPGLFYDSASMKPLANSLSELGYPAVVVPLEWWHWLPCLGGRGMRPILERINFAVQHVLRYGPDAPMPEPAYTISDFVTDFFQNPGGVLEVGGSTDPDEYPAIDPQGDDFRQLREDALAIESGRVALVGHSAGGWISRIFACGESYGGYKYDGARLVHSIVSLGSPHAAAEGVAYSSVKWLARKQSGPSTGPRFLAVGSSGIAAGDDDFAKSAYVFCGADQKDMTVEGDGVTPLDSALAVDGAETLPLAGVAHAPSYPAFGPTAGLAKRRQEGQPWYGSVEIVKRWLPWLQAGSSGAR